MEHLDLVWVGLVELSVAKKLETWKNRWHILRRRISCINFAEVLSFTLIGFWLQLIVFKTIAIWQMMSNWILLSKFELKIDSKICLGIHFWKKSEHFFSGFFLTLIKVGKTTKDNFQYDAFEETYYAKSVHCHSQNCKADGSPRVNDIALVRVERAISELERGWYQYLINKSIFRKNFRYKVWKQPITWKSNIILFKERCDWSCPDATVVPRTNKK